MEEVVGAILAGGRGFRLGRPKPTAPLAGRTLIDYPLAALVAAGFETVVVAKADTPLPPIRAPVWREPAEPIHPLLGIVTALERADGRAVLACACDMPFVTSELASEVAGREGVIAVPRAGGRLHPLFARYAPSALAALREGLERGSPLHETVSALGATVVEEHELRAFGDPEQLLFNVNTPGELERAEQILLAAG